MERFFLSVPLLFGASIGSAISAQTTASQGGSVWAGTTLRVRTIDPIDVNSARPGAKFSGSLADTVNTSDGHAVIPRAARVQLSAVNIEKAGRITGRYRIHLKVGSMTFYGKTYLVVSSIAESRAGRKGIRTLRGTGIGAAAGAVIGAIPGGGTGAAVGSLVGGCSGTALAAATGDKHLRIRLSPSSLSSFSPL